MSPIVIPALEFVGKIVDKIWPDKVAQAKERAQAELAILQLQQAGELQELEKRYSAIVAEAQSQDKWTSRARPSFMYVFYFLLISLVVLAPAIGVFFPGQMATFFANVGAGFKAVPEELWWVFTAGYLGYTGVRGYEKVKGVTK